MDLHRLRLSPLERWPVRPLDGRAVNRPSGAKEALSPLMKLG